MRPPGNSRRAPAWPLPTDTTSAAPTRNPAEVLFVLVLACASFSLSQTLAIPALPEIASDLRTTPEAASWILTAFLLSASISTPIVGKLGDVHGKGRVLTAVLLTFCAGAIVDALATSIGVVIAGRVLQGVAGGVFPLAFGIVRDTFPRERVPSGLGTVGAIFGIGAGIGLTLSGVIADHLGMPWLFWINLVALPGAIAAFVLSAALGAILLGVSEADSWGWGSPANVGLIGGGLVLVGVFVAIEAGVPEPLIDLAVLRQQAVATTNLTAFMVGVAMFASFLLIPRFAQAPAEAGYGFAASVTVAGLLMMPAAVVQLLTGSLAGRLGTRIGFRAVLAIGAGLMVASFLLVALAHGHEWEVVASGGLLGAGIAFTLAAMANLIVDAVRQADVGIATGINTVMRTVGGAFGAAIATAILAADTPGAGGLPGEGAYTAAFAFSAGAALLALGAALLVPRTPARPLPAVAGA
jgi:MFS family permease